MVDGQPTANWPAAPPKQLRSFPHEVPFYKDTPVGATYHKSSDGIFAEVVDPNANHIKSGESATFFARPQVLFSPKTLVVQPRVADGVIVTRVGRVDTDVLFDTNGECDISTLRTVIGQDVEVTLKNTSKTLALVAPVVYGAYEDYAGMFPLSFRRVLLSELVVEPGVVMELRTHTWCQFRVSRFGVGPKNSQAFRVLDMRIGREPLSVTQGSFEPEAFSVNGLLRVDSSSIASVGMDIAVVIQNAGHVPATLCPMWHGTGYEE